MEVTKSVQQAAILPAQKTQHTNTAQQGFTFAQALASYQSTSTAKASSKQTTEATVKMNTTKGNIEVNLDEYLSSKRTPESSSILDVPLLLPSAHNVDTLSKYSEQKVKALLAQYNIPTPPKTIQFDSSNQLVLPADYPHAAQLKQALNENPTVEKALQTTAALASHYAGIMEGQPFRDEMSTARSQADRDRIIEKYSYLFDDNRASKQIILSFLEDGSMLVGQDK
ncbi:MAG: hypothetical protein ACPG46_06200 [Thalassotalea sp.]